MEAMYTFYEYETENILMPYPRSYVGVPERIVLRTLDEIISKIEHLDHEPIEPSDDDCVYSVTYEELECHIILSNDIFHIEFQYQKKSILLVLNGPGVHMILGYEFENSTKIFPSPMNDRYKKIEFIHRLLF